MSDDLQFQRLVARMAKGLEPWFLKSRVWDDYGTYVPTYLGATTAGTTTYSVQVGFWARYGVTVYFTGRVIWTAATGTGVAIISLPFTTSNVTDKRYAIMLRTDGLTFANNNVVGSLAPNASAFSMTSLLTNAAPTNINVEAAGDVIFTGFFFKD